MTYPALVYPQRVSTYAVRSTFAPVQARTKAGRKDIIILGLELSVPEGYITNGYRGLMSHVMLFDFAVTDEAASLVYTDQEMFASDDKDAAAGDTMAKLAMTHNSMLLLHDTKPPHG